MTDFNSYQSELEAIVNNCNDVIKNSFEYTKFDDFSGYIKGQILFRNGTLIFREVISLKDNPHCRKKKYSYHFMNEQNELIFRYDNSIHPESLNIPVSHKHIGTKVIETHEPQLFEIIKEIIKI